MSRLVTLNLSATVLLLLLAACAGPDYRAIPDASIATTSGMVSAEAGPEGAMRYRDIPFAKPPVAGRRWAAPETLHTPDSQITPLPDMVMCPQPQSMAMPLGRISVLKIAFISMSTPRVTWLLRLLCP